VYIKEGIYVFESSRKTFYASNGIIGLSPDSNTVYDGYDGELDSPYAITQNPRYKGFSKEEKLELADYMIELWNKYKGDIV